MCGSRFGKILGLKKTNINKAFVWFDSKGNFAIFFGRFIPIIRSLVSIPAGMAKMPMFPFLILTTIGSLIWNTVLIMLGRIAGESWTRIAVYIGKYSNLVWIFFIGIFVFCIAFFYFKKRRRVKVVIFKKNKL